MPIRYSYLLYAKTIFEDNANVIGCFSSYKKAVAYLKTLPKEHVYQICKYKINKSILGKQDIIDFKYCIEHWHFGADFSPKFCLDKNDALFRDKEIYEYTISWPDQKEYTEYVKMSEFNKFIDNNPVLKKAILKAKGNIKTDRQYKVILRKGKYQNKQIICKTNFSIDSKNERIDYCRETIHY